MNDFFIALQILHECGARLDVRAQGFWGVRHQQAYFDVRVLIHLPAQITAILLPVAFGLMIEKSVGFTNNVCMKLKGHHSHLLCSQLWEE